MARYHPLYEDEEIFEPATSSPVARLGLISPEGRFYPCAYCAHRDLSIKLVIWFYEYKNIYPCAEKFLVDKGWISLKGGPFLHCGNFLTAEAKNTLRLIVEEFEFEEIKHPEELWEEKLLYNPEKYEVLGWGTRVDDLCLNGISFAGQLRKLYDSERRI